MAQDRQAPYADRAPDTAATPSRAERLAAQLRANLHRRKARARADGQADDSAPAED